jgi:hypothetical protein
MDAVIVQPRTQDELKFISDLMTKLGVRSRRVDETELEDYGLSLLMKDVDRRKKVSTSSVMRKLRSK